MPKIQLLKGTRPYLIVAPHGGGPTDLRSARMAAIIAHDTDAYAVINTGWVRPWKGHMEGTNQNIDTKFDIANGFANLNDIRQAKKKPIRQQFLDPIEDYKNIILQKHKRAYIFLIHGMDDTIRDYKGVDLVVGYGAGDPPRHSCSLGFKDRLISCSHMYNFTPAQGKKGGRLSAWGAHNLNQLYSNEQDVFSVQLEVALTIRQTDKLAEHTASQLAHVINITMSSVHVPHMRRIPER